MKKIDISEHNKSYWMGHRRSNKFINMEGLQDPEKVLFDKYHTLIDGGLCIDLGVGCGRTSKALVNLGAKYIGVDYSPVMIDVCQKKFPDYNYQIADARDLKFLSDESVDVVVFAYNGLDCLGAEDRLVVLKEVYSKLKFNGVLIFSSHNYQSKNLNIVRNPWHYLHLPKMTFSIDFMKGWIKYFIGILSHYRLKKYQRFFEGAAELNEQTNRFREIMYYITPCAQKQQLHSLGFELKDTCLLNGDIVENLENIDEPWVYYACIKIK